MRRTQNSFDPPSWILEALQVLRPPGRMTVSEWADANRVLGIGESSRPGRWHTDFVPYLREVMDAFCDPEVEEIIFVKPTQVGGTEAMLNMMGYAICHDPAPMLMVYPKDELAERMINHRVLPMIQSSGELRSRFDAANSKKDDLCFTGGINVGIASANSPSDLASRPIKNLFLDEEDKFPERSGKEAAPSALAMERQGTYQFSRKTVRASTPTFERGVIWQNWLNANTQMRCLVKCPHCGAEWTFKFKQLKWPDGADEEQARRSAFYVCEECGAAINDLQKAAMIKACCWDVLKTNGSRRRIAFHLNTFYSPWKRFGDIAAKWIECHKRPELLQNFINSWLAEPFKEVESQIDAQKLLDSRQSIFKREEVPPGTVILSGGVDVQKQSFYWTIRAWRQNMTSYNVAHGQAFSWLEIEEVMNRWYTDRDGGQYQVNLCAVDSGDQVDDVYNFCAVNREWTTPVKGSSNKMLTRYRLSCINRDGISNGMLLCIVDTDYYKDMIFSRFFRDEDNGGWFLHDECDPEYAEMLTAEQKVIERFRGHLVSHWVQKVTGGDNHYWDCEVYAACAADIYGLRTMSAEQARQEQQPEQPTAFENAGTVAAQDGFRHVSNDGGHSFRRGKGW